MIFDLIAGMGAVAASGNWTPATLFQSGEQGFWFDPSDLSTLFQDIAGTVPVTADGQAVALIQDKSGRNNHATQATLASRPLYKTDGTHHWLAFDGIDDFVTIATMPVASLPGTSFMGFRHGTKSRWIMFQFTAQSSSYWFYARNGTNAAVFGTTMGSPSFRINAVDQVGLNTQTLYDKLVNIKSVQTAVNLVLGTLASSLSISTSLTNQISGDMYSVVLLARQATAQEIDYAEAWTNSKIGAY